MYFQTLNIIFMYDFDSNGCTWNVIPNGNLDVFLSLQFCALFVSTFLYIFDNYECLHFCEPLLHTFAHFCLQFSLNYWHALLHTFTPNLFPHLLVKWLIHMNFCTHLVNTTFFIEKDKLIQKMQINHYIFWSTLTSPTNNLTKQIH